MRIDGGMSANDWLCQFLANILNVPVERPAVLETTALGAAYLAGISIGYWDGPEGIATLPRRIDRFEPHMENAQREVALAGWRKALGQALRGD